ncbi:MAG: hypothetical protein ACLSWV_04585, partial [Pygmaiobacter massiliensis]
MAFTGGKSTALTIFPFACAAHIFHRIFCFCGKSSANSPCAIEDYLAYVMQKAAGMLSAYPPPLLFYPFCCTVTALLCAMHHFFQLHAQAPSPAVH